MKKPECVKLREDLFYNPHLDTYHFATDHPKKLGPISIGLQVTRRCNANCIHCAASKFVPEPDTSSILEIIEQLHIGGCVRLSITGGEPLVRQDLTEILKKASSLGMATTLSTNGFALSESKIIELKPYLTNIRLSLHGLQAVNDRIFQKQGAFKSTLKKIESCVKKDIPTGVIYTVMKTNIGDYIDLVRILDALKVRKLIVFTLMNVGRAKNLYEEELVSAPIMNKFLLEFEKIKKQEGLNIQVNLVDWRLEGQCLLVAPSGLLYCYDPNSPDDLLKLGNVLEESVDSLWEKFPYKKNYLNYYISH